MGSGTPAVVLDPREVAQHEQAADRDQQRHQLADRLADRDPVWRVNRELRDRPAATRRDLRAGVTGGVGALDEDEDDCHPEDELDAHDQRTAETLEDRRHEWSPVGHRNERQDDRGKWDHDPGEAGQQLAIRLEELGADEVLRAPGVVGREACRIAQALQHGGLGGGAVLAGFDAIGDGIGNRGAQLALHVGALVLREPA